MIRSIALSLALSFTLIAGNSNVFAQTDFDLPELNSADFPSAPQLLDTEANYLTRKAPAQPRQETHSVLVGNPAQQRAPGNGMDARGTFATSDHLPVENNDTNHAVGGMTHKLSDQSFGSLTDNGLRGGSSSSMNPARKMRWDEKPNLPATNQPTGSRRGYDPNQAVVSQSFGDSNPNNAPTHRLSDRTMQNDRTMQDSAALQANRAPSFNARPNEMLNNRMGSTLSNTNASANTIPSYGNMNGIKKAGFQQQTQMNSQTSNKVDLRRARELVERYQISRAPDPLPGAPTKLVSLLQQTPTNMRAPMVAQYWETYYDWANLLSSVEHLKWLKQFPNPPSQVDRITLHTAKMNAENNVLAAEIQLGKSQSKLQQYMPSSKSNDLLPLPSDQPLVQTYKTHYDWYASRGMMPAKLRGINLVLPKALQLIANRAETVHTARVALNQTRNAFASRELPIASVLESARQWEDSEKKLIASVVSYNQAISDYSMTLTANGKSPEQIVKMLISKPKTAAPATRKIEQQTAGRMRRRPMTREELVGNNADVTRELQPTIDYNRGNQMARNPQAGSNLNSQIGNRNMQNGNSFGAPKGLLGSQNNSGAPGNSRMGSTLNSRTFQGASNGGNSIYGNNRSTNPRDNQVKQSGMLGPVTNGQSNETFGAAKSQAKGNANPIGGIRQPKNLSSGDFDRGAAGGRGTGSFQQKDKLNYSNSGNSKSASDKNSFGSPLGR